MGVGIVVRGSSVLCLDWERARKAAGFVGTGGEGIGEGGMRVGCCHCEVGSEYVLRG